VNGLAFRNLVLKLEVGDVQRAYGLDGRAQRLVDVAAALLRGQSLSRGPQRPQHLCTVEALTRAMFAKTHGVFPSRIELAYLAIF
jgi:hypothetical protein